MLSHGVRRASGLGVVSTTSLRATSRCFDGWWRRRESWVLFRHPAMTERSGCCFDSQAEYWSRCCFDTCDYAKAHRCCFDTCGRGRPGCCSDTLAWRRGRCFDGLDDCCLDKRGHTAAVRLDERQRWQADHQPANQQHERSGDQRVGDGLRPSITGKPWTVVSTVQGACLRAWVLFRHPGECGTRVLFRHPCTRKQPGVVSTPGCVLAEVLFRHLSL